MCLCVSSASPCGQWLFVRIRACSYISHIVSNRKSVKAAEGETEAVEVCFKLSQYSFQRSADIITYSDSDVNSLGFPISLICINVWPWFFFLPSKINFLPHSFTIWNGKFGLTNFKGIKHTHTPRTSLKYSVGCLLIVYCDPVKIFCNVIVVSSYTLSLYGIKCTHHVTSWSFSCPTVCVQPRLS